MKLNLAILIMIISGVWIVWYNKQYVINKKLFPVIKISYILLIIFAIIQPLPKLIDNIFTTISSIKTDLVKQETDVKYISIELNNINNKNYMIIQSLLENYKLSARDLENIMSIYVSGRKLTMTGLQNVLNEKIPNINVELIETVNSQIISNYTEFSRLQTEKLNILKGYESYINEGWFRPYVVKKLGYPKINIEEYKSDIKQVTIK